MTNKERALVPIEQKDVLFYEDEITAVRVRRDGSVQVFVPLRPIVELLGLDWSGQLRRVRNDAVLAQEIETVRVNTAGGPQEMPCLPLDMLNGWLFGINANRVKEDVRQRLVRYQRDCYRVLYEAFEEGRLSTTADVTFQELLQQSDSEAVEAYRMLQAMIKMARNQIIIESRLGVHGERLAEHERRLEQLEERFDAGKGQTISESQASQISQAVKAVAMALSKQTGRNEYGGVYGELYRRFEITSYKLLPASRFGEAMKFLSEWYASLTGEAEF